MDENISVAGYTGDDRAAWNDFNRNARNGHFLFDRDFMEYHADRFTDAALIMRRAGAIIGILPANVSEGRVQSHGGLTFGGLIVGNCHLVEVQRMLDLAIKWWRAAGYDELVYKPLPQIYHRRPSEDDLYWLHNHGARLVHRNVSTTVALDAPGLVSSRRRRGAAKATRLGLRFNRASDWRGFWLVLEQVLAGRHGARPVHRVEEIERLASLFPESIQLHVALDAEVLLAGVVLFINGGVWHAQYIANSARGREAGALDGLFLDIMSKAQAGGAKYFDFGISTEQGGRILNEGLVTQKEEFGGSATCYDTYAISLRADENPLSQP